MFLEIKKFANHSVGYGEITKTEKGNSYLSQITLENVRVQQVTTKTNKTGADVLIGGYAMYYLIGHSTGLIDDFVIDSKIELNGKEYFISSIYDARYDSSNIQYIKVVFN